VNYACFSGGGAITCYYSSPIIVDNTIINNESDDGSGGIYLYESSPIIRNNVIINNMAYSGNGGIRCEYESSPMIENNIFTENQGAAIACVSESSPSIKENTITENDCGISTDGAYPTIVDNIIMNNTDRGIQCNSDFSIIKGNMITGNNGGGISGNFSSLIIAGNTIAGNTADQGGGIYSWESSLTVLNCILWDDSPEEIYSEGGDPVVVYSDVQGGWAGEGNIDDDPLFVDPENNDFGLLPDSPCIDAGHPAIPNIPWGGFRRDIGALEYDQGFYFDGQNLIRKPVPVEFSDKR
jgi:parallel beta-helix repeat protein